jgi:hypothetical protein
VASQWRRWQESGTHATVEESAGAEKISDSYVGRVLRLTLLAPDIVEAILGGRQPAKMAIKPSSIVTGRLCVVPTVAS